jgi:hypothetical protein
VLVVITLAQSGMHDEYPMLEMQCSPSNVSKNAIRCKVSLHLVFSVG